ncbi:hypothetical protein U9M48_031640 [Paspalum notatum var. saurae]|uniref:Uncharacterized protein n=1 Tax=Paspalum notatum var. saurae TaxID=547442 RepID=A0AAQ3U303_PASNO
MSPAGNRISEPMPPLSSWRVEVRRMDEFLTQGLIAINFGWIALVHQQYVVDSIKREKVDKDLLVPASNLRPTEQPLEGLVASQTPELALLLHFLAN